MEMIDSNREQSKMIRKLSSAFCTCASYTKPQPDSFARCRKWAESVDKTGELEYKEITTKTFLEHSGIHGTENGFG